MVHSESQILDLEPVLYCLLTMRADIYSCLHQHRGKPAAVSLSPCWTETLRQPYLNDALSRIGFMETNLRIHVGYPDSPWIVRQHLFDCSPSFIIFFCLGEGPLGMLAEDGRRCCYNLPSLCLWLQCSFQTYHVSRLAGKRIWSA